MNGDGTRRGSGARRRSSGDALPGAAADEESRRKPDDPEQLARDMVYRLLAARARSRSELRQALLRKEIDEEVADAVLQKFVDAGLVDDASFAEEWVHSRQRHQGLGRKALGFELRRKGVDEHLVEAALSTVDGDAEVERARELVQRKLRTMANLDHAAKLRRLVGMLARKGYSEGLAFRVVREEIERSGDDAPDSDLEST
ncbi:regulatory protein [Saccharopolyspora shandongensis]|uniref:Regulatory protein RecX n=2 Tax=Saccharopolyspora shandongensis TaxID=418495 RepID=A0A1H3ALB6_9PSEU|nr:regulatory protein [Saccharopolyspora shandongensis]